jgi:hypothetical protein
VGVCGGYLCGLEAGWGVGRLAFFLLWVGEVMGVVVGVGLDGMGWDEIWKDEYVLTCAILGPFKPGL